MRRDLDSLRCVSCPCRVAREQCAVLESAPSAAAAPRKDSLPRGPGLGRASPPGRPFARAERLIATVRPEAPEFVVEMRASPWLRRLSRFAVVDLSTSR